MRRQDFRLQDEEWRDGFVPDYSLGCSLSLSLSSRSCRPVTLSDFVQCISYPVSLSTSIELFPPLFERERERSLGTAPTCRGGFAGDARRRGGGRARSTKGSCLTTVSEEGRGLVLAALRETHLARRRAQLPRRVGRQERAAALSFFQKGPKGDRGSLEEEQLSLSLSLSRVCVRSLSLSLSLVYKYGQGQALSDTF